MSPEIAHYALRGFMVEHHASPEMLECLDGVMRHLRPQKVVHEKDSPQPISHTVRSDAVVVVSRPEFMTREPHNKPVTTQRGGRPKGSKNKPKEPGVPDFSDENVEKPRW